MENTAHIIVKRMCDALNHTWDIIGGDILESRKVMGESTELTREEVMEIITDADYLKTYGGDEQAYNAFMHLNEFEREEVLRLAFPFKTYSY